MAAVVLTFHFRVWRAAEGYRGHAVQRVIASEDAHRGPAGGLRIDADRRDVDRVSVHIEGCFIQDRGRKRLGQA